MPLREHKVRSTENRGAEETERRTLGQGRVRVPASTHHMTGLLAPNEKTQDDTQFYITRGDLDTLFTMGTRGLCNR